MSADFPGIPGSITAEAWRAEAWRAEAEAQKQAHLDLAREAGEIIAENQRLRARVRVQQEQIRRLKRQIKAAQHAAERRST